MLNTQAVDLLAELLVNSIDQIFLDFSKLSNSLRRWESRGA